MKFGPVPTAQALGCVLAHSLKLPSGVLRKGHRLEAADLERLAWAGFGEVVVAKLEAEDVPEDVAAARLAEALSGAFVQCESAQTGRANLSATAHGLLCLDVARIHQINAVHESLTVATLPAFDLVEPGQMLATIKVIPYAVPAAALSQVLEISRQGDAAVRVAPRRALSAGLVMTRLADTPTRVLAKMHDAVDKRLRPLGSQLVEELVVPHEIGPLAQALARLGADSRLDLLLVSGIAATVDREDVVPAALCAAGGKVLRAGMPVDPGNLLLLGELPRSRGPCVVIGMPTCARSPKLNGFDFVLRRLACGLPVGSVDVAAMGVGGLLSEIPGRPMPRGGIPT